MNDKNKLAEIVKRRNIKISITAQIYLAKDEIETALDNRLSPKEIYTLLQSENKLNCCYDGFRRALKNFLKESATKMTGTTTIAKKAKPEEPEGFHPIDNPEDFRDELI